MLKIICTVILLSIFIKEILMAYENSPIIIDETPGIKNYCTCGESNNKPYCDGSHSAQATGKTPKEFIVDENCPRPIVREFLAGLFGGDGSY